MGVAAIAAGDDAFAVPANADPVSASGRHPHVTGLPHCCGIRRGYC